MNEERNGRGLKTRKSKNLISYFNGIGAFLLILILALVVLFGAVLTGAASESGGINVNYSYDAGEDTNNNDNGEEPDVSTRNATNVSTISATLNGRVDGNGSSTGAWFEYGRDRDLDDRTSERSVGSGTDDFSARVTGRISL